MERIGGLERMLLGIESRSTTMDTVGILLLDPPPPPQEHDFDRFKAVLAQRVPQLPQLVRRPFAASFGAGPLHWIADRRFTVEDHLEQRKLARARRPRVARRPGGRGDGDAAAAATAAVARLVRRGPAGRPGGGAVPRALGPARRDGWAATAHRAVRRAALRHRRRRRPGRAAAGVRGGAAAAGLRPAGARAAHPGPVADRAREPGGTCGAAGGVGRRAQGTVATSPTW